MLSNRNDIATRRQVGVSSSSNATEEHRLRADGYRDVLTGAIARAVVGYGM